MLYLACQRHPDPAKISQIWVTVLRATDYPRKARKGGGERERERNYLELELKTKLNQSHRDP